MIASPARVRSPGYPSISLPEAIGLMAARLESHLSGKAMSREQVIAGLGFHRPHGPSSAALSAVRKYGLVARKDDAYRVTRLAHRILSPTSLLDRTAALEQALRSPSIFGQLVVACGGKEPTEKVVRHYLGQAGFSSRAIPALAASFLRSWVFVKEAAAELGEPGADRENTGKSRLRVSIGPVGIDVAAVCSSVEDVERLIAALEAAKVVLPHKAERN